MVKIKGVKKEMIEELVLLHDMYYQCIRVILKQHKQDKLTESQQMLVMSEVMSQHAKMVEDGNVLEVDYEFFKKLIK